MAAASSGPSEYFLGLPIPAAAGLLVAMIIAALRTDYQLAADDWWAPVVLIFLGVLMVSNVRFRTFKATKMSVPLFLGLMAFFGALIVIAMQIGPSIAILLLMLIYLAAGLLESVWRLFQDTDDGDDEPVMEDFDADLLDPLLEDGEEELID